MLIYSTCRIALTYMVIHLTIMSVCVCHMAGACTYMDIIALPIIFLRLFKFKVF